MIQGLIGTKVGMTQLFDEDGQVSPVTVIQVGPCVVVQRKTVEVDGYEAVQVGLVDAGAAKRANKPMRGHHEKAGVPPTRARREFAIPSGDETKPGDALSVEVFDGVNLVDVVGTSKGKGFQGVIKRHNFRWRASDPRLDVPSISRLDRSVRTALESDEGDAGPGPDGQCADPP